MTDGIGRLSGYGNYGVGGYIPQRRNDVDGANAVDAATQDRVAGYMEQFEMIYGIVQEEFGEELAPAVMDIVMDRLMGMAE